MPVPSRTSKRNTIARGSADKGARQTGHVMIGSARVALGKSHGMPRRDLRYRKVFPPMRRPRIRHPGRFGT